MPLKICTIRPVMRPSGTVPSSIPPLKKIYKRVQLFNHGNRYTIWFLCRWFLNTPEEGRSQQKPCSAVGEPLFFLSALLCISLALIWVLLFSDPASPFKRLKESSAISSWSHKKRFTNDKDWESKQTEAWAIRKLKRERRGEPGV